MIAESLLNNGLTNKHDERKRAAELSGALLQRGKCVLILDDVWDDQKFHLEEVGICLKVNGCKLILTTRSLNVCRRIACQKKIKVDSLPWQETWDLFKETLGHGLTLSPGIEEVAISIAKRCAGLPLGIITIAGSMREVDDIREWRNVLEELEKPTTGQRDMQDEVFPLLKLSYDRLKDAKLQHCFLYCALYPEDKKIKRKELITFFIVEGIIDRKKSMQAKFDMGHTLLNKLENACLLESCEDFDGERCVKMHDLMREMALEITKVSPRFMVKSGWQFCKILDEKEWMEDLEKVSLMSCGIKIPEGMSPRCPKLSTLLLTDHGFFAKIPHSFFVHMRALRVLDLSDNLICELPDSMLNLENLTALFLQNCRSLEYVPPLGNLRALQVLNLSRTSIEEVPQGMEMLVNLNCLYMERMIKNVTFPTGILHRLSHLQVLRFDHCRKQEVRSGELKELMLLEEIKCQIYDICDFKQFVKSQCFMQLSLCDIAIGPVGGWCTGEFKYTKKDQLVRMINISLEGDGGKVDAALLPREIRECNISISDKIEYIVRFPFSNEIEVEEDSGEESRCVPLQSLEILKLESLGNLRAFIKWGRQGGERVIMPLPADTFSNLKVLDIRRCDKIKNLFQPGLLQYLQNLEHICAVCCYGMEKIIAEDDAGMGACNNNNNNPTTFSLPKLKKFELISLPSLKSICKGVMACDSIETIKIVDCRQLKRVQFSLPLINGQPVPPHALQRIELDTDGVEWWESLEWDHPNDRNVLQPFVTPLQLSRARQRPSWSLDDLPRTVAFTMHQGSAVAGMDFHPSHHTLLLVGSVNGEITLYEVGMREQLVSKSFKIWDIAPCSLSFQASHVKDAPISVSRVAWSPDGHFMGAAFTKHLIHLYTYLGSNDLRQLLEVDAHVGGVNDLAFAHLNKQLCVVTCGDDKLIKVWDLAGRKQYSCEGHEAPVFSICPQEKENVQFIFSTAIDGKIKAWLYDNMGSRVDYDAPGRWCTTMIYSADGSRLFSCGTSKEGDTFLVEWNEREGTIERTYTGFRKKSAGVVQFDTTQNGILAAGEDNQIKFWDMDNLNILTSTDAEGGLPSLPRLRFNMDGNLLAVSTAENGFKILATAAGLRSLRVGEPSSFEALKSSVEPAAIKVSGSSAVANVSPVNCKVERSSPVRPSAVLNGVNPMSKSMEKPRTLADVTDKTKPWQLAEIVDPVQCRLVTMPDSTDTGNKVARLLYTNSGVGILALGSNGIQKLWKWVHNEQNPSGKATANVVPLHWQPNSGLLMTNDTSGVNLEEAVPCIALSKNDSYVMSASGGKVSLLNMVTFKVMTTFMPPPPASTFLAFHPRDNNVIAVGMEDSTIHIYNVSLDEVKSKLKSHQKRVTGLAFSTNLNILVSSGADAQLCIWSIDSWEKRKSVPLQLPTDMVLAGETRVQFHSNQILLLASHETQLAIYDASKMDRICQWIPQDALSAPISYAAYSCNSQLVYTSFCDGNIGVFNADSLRLRCRIAPSAYLSQAVLNGSQAVYPLVVAAHPQEPHQFAVGLTDGSVKVMEPSESEGKWGESPPVDNGMLNGRTGSSSTTSNHASDQVQR
ncbi:hypothetical protein F0562_029282 [Nyssa sinensis]|uniref:Leucine-rich repeat and WD repeat-containing protein 1 n=1 Tax=Nyssa sinensis TaxID=561372 RepID=A0A5J5B2I8_9ASTE|nr:hypothetical protein F0562_029282 [Nyssa sinensis]